MTYEYPRPQDTPVRRERRRMRQLRIFTALLLPAGLFLLVIGVLFRPSIDSRSHLIADLAGQLGALLVLVATVLTIYEHLVRRWLVDELVRVASPAIVTGLLPQQAMTILLESVYGSNPANHDVVNGVLGGEGIRPHGADLSVSTRTSVRYELKAQVPGTYELLSTVEYRFRTTIVDHRLVIFATCDPRLRDIIVAGCNRPLFEYWFVRDQELFAESVNGMLNSVYVGIRYRDAAGDQHEVDLSPVRLNYVSFNEWEQLLTFFREPMGLVPYQDPRLYLGTLRIYECDLSELEDEEHPIVSIDGLTLRSSTLQSTDDGYCFWQPPYPCFVEEITFDVVGLVTEGGGTWSFRVVPFMFRAGSVPAGWASAQHRLGVKVDSWMLPGHGVALLWKPLASPDGERRK